MSDLLQGGQGRTSDDIKSSGEVLFSACIITGLLMALILAFVIF